MNLDWPASEAPSLSETVGNIHSPAGTSASRRRFGRKPQPTQSNNDKVTQLANRHSRLLAVLPAGVIVIDGEGIVQEANNAAIDLLGQPLSGEPWIDIIQRAFSPRPGDGHDVSLKDGRLVHISTNPLTDEPGQLVLLHDVTETRALQNKVSHMQRLSTMGEVAARLAHQIRTPLASALLYLSPLLKENSGDAVKIRFARKLRDSLTHMEQLVKDLLAFSRGEIAESEPVATTNLLNTAARQFSAQSDAENYQLEVNNQIPDSYVFASQAALVSAINNLLNNAKQACGEHGEITLSAEYSRDQDNKQWIDICVEDNGTGISAAEREKIMTPFYTTRAAGTGLGLAVVQSIVTAHKGQLWLESEEGEGSTFGMRIPLFQAEAEPAHAVAS